MSTARPVTSALPPSASSSPCCRSSASASWPKPEFHRNQSGASMTDPLFDLFGQTAVVTGASRGIGAASAKLLAAHGAHVIVSSRKQDGVDATAEEIRAAGGQATALACHIGDIEAMDAFFDRIDADFGAIDI